MKKIIFSIFSLFILSSVCFAGSLQTLDEQTQQKIAIVPYLDTSEQDKDYVPGIIDANYTNYFSTIKGITVVPQSEVKKALDNYGYDVSNMVLPDKDAMSEVAKATNADYVVAAEIVQMDAIRHMSFFQAKISVNAKMKYHFYNAKTNIMTPFQTTGSSDNATVFGGVGFKAPIEVSLNQAMSKANEKIVSFINK